MHYKNGSTVKWLVRLSDSLKHDPSKTAIMLIIVKMINGNQQYNANKQMDVFLELVLVVKISRFES